MAKCVVQWKWFADFSVKQLIGVLACFTDVNVPDEYRASYPRSKDEMLVDRLEELQHMFHVFEDEEREREAYTGISYDRAIQFDVIDAFMEWVDCEDEMACKAFLQRLTASEKAISAGDFAKAGMKIATLARELETMCGSVVMEGSVEFQHKLSQIPGHVLKYITTTQSLYL